MMAFYGFFCTHFCQASLGFDTLDMRRLVSHTHTHTIDVIVDVRMTSCDVIVGIGMTSLPVYGHTVCDTRLGLTLHSKLELSILWQN